MFKLNKKLLKKAEKYSKKVAEEMVTSLRKLTF